MLCKSCSTEVPEGQPFCGQCGHKVNDDNLASVAARVARIEAQIAASSSNVAQQNYLELETAERVMARVKTWTTLILYFAGIPAALLLLALAVMFGKGTLDLYHIASSAKQSVNGILKEAQTEASNATTIANDALATSKRVDEDIKGIRAQMSTLKTDVSSRSEDVRNVGLQIADSQKQVETLKGSLNTQSQQVQHLSEQVRTVQTAKNVADVQNIYPVFGQHMARTTNQWIDPKQKSPGTIYVDLNLYLTATPSISDADVGVVIAALNNRKYFVFLGPIYTYARTSSNAQAVGMGLDANSCLYWLARPGSGPPCLVYFHESLKNSAREVQSLLKVAQVIPDNHVFYLDPAKLDPQKRELLDLSAIDIVVVLGQQ